MKIIAFVCAIILTLAVLYQPSEGLMCYECQSLDGENSVCHTGELSGSLLVKNCTNEMTKCAVGKLKLIGERNFIMRGCDNSCEFKQFKVPVGGIVTCNEHCETDLCNTSVLISGSCLTVILTILVGNILF